MSKTWAIGKPGADIHGIRTPQAALEQLLGTLLGTPLEVPVHRRSNGIYTGETVVAGIDDLAQRAHLEVAVRSETIRVGYEGLPVGEFSPEIPFHDDTETLYVQYQQGRTGLEILGVSTDSIAAQERRPTIIEEPQRGVDGERSAPTTGHPPAPDVDHPGGQFLPPAADIPAAEEVRRGPNRELLLTNTKLYLAQCIEQRLRNTPELYDVATNTVTFPKQRQALSLDETLQYDKAARILGKAKSAVKQWKTKGQPLLRYSKEAGGIRVEDIFCVHLADISSRRSYTLSEIAGFFGTAEQDINAIPGRYFQRSDTVQSYSVRKRFRESFTLAIDALREGRSLLEDVVIEERARGIKVPVENAGEEELGALARRPVQEYDPDALVTDLWVAYRLGAVPKQAESIRRVKEKVFCRKGFEPSKRVGQTRLYRTGDFLDQDFADFGMTAQEVLTNPYVREYDPEELIGPAYIARVLGLGFMAASQRLQNSGAALAVDKATVKRCRRGDVHEKLGLPGWLQENPPLGSPAPENSAVSNPVPSVSSGGPGTSSVPHSGSPSSAAPHGAIAGRSAERGDSLGAEITAARAAAPERTDYRIPSRRQPPLRHGIYEYDLRYASEPTQEAARTLAGAYRREFQRRLLERSIDQGTILGNEIFLGKDPRRRVYAADEYVSFQDLERLFNARESVISRAFRNVPHELRMGQTISPFAALVLYSPVEQPDRKKQPEDVITHVGKDRALDALLIDQEMDQQLVAFMDDARIISPLSGHDTQEVISSELFARIYRPLSQQWALIMASARERGLLMQEINYVDETAVLNILQRRGHSAEAAYQKIELLRGTAVLGMVHLEKVNTV